MDILEVLNRFDIEDRKGFDYYQVASELSSNTDINDKKKLEFAYENTAFELVAPHNENPWGFYYGPRLTFKDEEGKPVYYPSFYDISIDAILYWEKRAQTCKNPLLISRYAGLVWEFKSKIAHKKQEPWIYKKYIDNMLRVCNENYCSHPFITVNVLKRLFAVTIKQQIDLQKVKDAYDKFEKEYAKDKDAYIWGQHFLLMIENKKCFSDEEIKELIKNNEERLERLQSQNEPWSVKEQAELLAKYYSSLQKIGEVKRVLNIIEKAFDNNSDKMSAMQYMGNLEMVSKLYSHYCIKEDVKKISVKIQGLGKKVKDEMQSFNIKIEIPKKIFDEADLLFGEKASSEMERCSNFVTLFIPKKSEEENSLRKNVEQYPLIYISGNTLMDTKGHPMSYIGPYDSDQEGNLILYMTQTMINNHSFLGIAINCLLKTETLTVDNVMNKFIKVSPIFEQDRYDIIKEALQFFIEGKYVLFCHLIVPQIEKAICNLVEKSGFSILKPQKNNKGFQLRTLDDLLREKCIERTFSPDIALYLQLVLTNQKALNIRNLLCHGILSPDNFGLGVAGRLFHVLILLGKVRKV